MSFFGMVVIIGLALIAAFCFIYWLEWREAWDKRLTEHVEHMSQTDWLRAASGVDNQKE